MKLKIARSVEELKEEAVQNLSKIKNISNLELYLKKQEESLFGPVSVSGLSCRGKVNCGGRETEFEKEFHLHDLFFNKYSTLALAIKNHYESQGIKVEIKKDIYSDKNEQYEKASYETQQIIDRFPFITHWVQIVRGIEEEVVKDLVYWPNKNAVSCYVWGTTEDGKGDIVTIPQKTRNYERVKQELIDYCNSKGIEVKLG